MLITVSTPVLHDVFFLYLQLYLVLLNHVHSVPVSAAGQLSAQWPGWQPGGVGLREVQIPPGHCVTA